MKKLIKKNKIVLIITSIIIVILCAVFLSVYIFLPNINNDKIIQLSKNEFETYYQNIKSDISKNGNKFTWYVNSKDFNNPKGIITYKTITSSGKDDYLSVIFNFTRDGINSFKKTEKSYLFFTGVGVKTYDEIITILKVNNDPCNSENNPKEFSCNTNLEPTLEQLELRKKQDLENEETRKLSIEARNTPLATRIKEIKEDLQTFALCIPNEPAPDGTISKVNKDKKIDNIECNYFIKNGYEYKSRMERIISNYEKCGLDPLADKKKCD